MTGSGLLLLLAPLGGITTMLAIAIAIQGCLFLTATVLAITADQAITDDDQPPPPTLSPTLSKANGARSLTTRDARPAESTRHAHREDGHLGWSGITERLVLVRHGRITRADTLPSTRGTGTTRNVSRNPQQPEAAPLPLPVYILVAPGALATAHREVATGAKPPTGTVGRKYLAAAISSHGPCPGRTSRTSLTACCRIRARPIAPLGMAPQSADNPPQTRRAEIRPLLPHDPASKTPMGCGHSTLRDPTTAPTADPWVAVSLAPGLTTTVHKS